MPNQFTPNYGRRVRPQPLKVIYPHEHAAPMRQALRPTRTSVIHRSASPRSASYTPRQTMPVFTPRYGRTPVMLEQSAPKPKRLFKRTLVGAFAMLLIGFTVFHGYAGSHNVAQAISESSPIASVTKLVDPTQSAEAAAAAEKEARMQKYAETVSSLIAAHQGENIAVASIDSEGNDVQSLGDQGTFTAASTTKLISAVILLHEIENGRLTLNTKISGQTASSLLQAMIINSDNAAWEKINRYLTHATLKTYMAQVGFTDYDPSVNTVMPSDMVMLLQKLNNGKLINREHSDLLMSYMAKANKREYIFQNVPTGYKVYHKAGWLDGLMHDVAIISNGKKTIVLAIYTYSGTTKGDTPANQALFKDITTAAIQAYFGE